MMRSLLTSRVSSTGCIAIWVLASYLLANGVPVNSDGGSRLSFSAPYLSSVDDLTENFRIHWSGVERFEPGGSTIGRDFRWIIKTDTYQNDMGTLDSSFATLAIIHYHRLSQYINYA